MPKLFSGFHPCTWLRYYLQLVFTMDNFVNSELGSYYEFSFALNVQLLCASDSNSLTIVGAVH